MRRLTQMGLVALVVVAIGALLVGGTLARGNSFWGMGRAGGTMHAGDMAGCGAGEMPMADGLHAGAMMGGAMHGSGGMMGQQVADLLGLTPEQLAAELHAGKSLAQLAEARGVARQALIDTMAAAAGSALAAQVADGRLTQEQADRMLAHMLSNLEWMVDQTMPMDHEATHDSDHNMMAGGAGMGGMDAAPNGGHQGHHGR